MANTSEARRASACRPPPNASGHVARPDAALARDMRVVWTTPNGLTGTGGGMDRVSQLIMGAIDAGTLRGVKIILLTTRGKWGLGVGAFVFVCALARFALIACRGGVDVLHINLAAYGSAYRKLILAHLARAFSIPYIVHIHTGRFDKFLNRASPRLTAALGRFFEQSAGVIVLGHGFRCLIGKRFPRLEAKVHILANATPSLRRTRSEVRSGDRLQLTAVGYIGPNKNTAQLIEALGRLKSRTDWVATIAGDGFIDTARMHVNRLGLADRVSLPGWIDHAAVQELLDRTDIFVLPSLSEGMPMTILEALSLGVPVVATPVGAIPDVVGHERNGLLIPVGDLDALVNAIARLLDDGDLRRSLGAQGLRDHAERHDIERYMERLKGIWSAAVRQTVA
jgi:glycosyltransferase involved in cell wall biosynthesis